MRGKLRGHLAAVKQDGITPAGAGKTAMDDYTLARKTDHPRRCGENYSQDNSEVGGGGSPPQVRGKRSTPKVSAALKRITPAGAGKTAQDRCLSAGYEDHPRRCGENTSIPFSVGVYVGSPPQVRGKRRQPCQFCQANRITPAGAGKTDFAHILIHRGVGSPPQVRGKLDFGCDNAD